METLGYLHHHLAYDDPDQYEVTLDWEQVGISQVPDLDVLSGQTAFRLMALVAGLGVLLTSNQAWAVLRYGDMDVATLQNDLISAGYLRPGLATGRFLTLTEAAVRSLQQSCGVAVDGIVGPQTQACLGKHSTTPPTGGSVLRFGDQGPAVTALQQDLVRLRLLGSNSVTGFFGTQTEQAVRAAQGNCGLRVDGVVGPQTRACISASLASTSGGPVVRPIVTNPVIINRPVVQVTPQPAPISPQPLPATRTVVLSDGTVIEVAVR